MKVALFFGSFNPIHVGHLIIANHIANNTDTEQVWLVVSPHNPLKEKSSLLNEYDRLHLVNLAIENDAQIKACQEEFHLPKPSYTIDTLVYLQEKYPQHEFSLIMGSDNILTINKWKNYTLILQRFRIYVYARSDFDNKQVTVTGSIHYLNVPLLDISSTYIRKCIHEKKSIKYLVPADVERYIVENNLYKNLLT